MLHDQDPFGAQQTMQQVPLLLSHMISVLLLDPLGWERERDGAEGLVGAVVPTRQLSHIVCGVDGHSLFNYLSLKLVDRKVLRDLAREYD